MDALQKSPDVARMASYGMNKMDSVIKEIKPDVLISVQDIWGIDFSISKPWFSKISAALWTTLDSLPILPTAIEAAKKVKNFWVWSKFAEEDMRKQGFKNVKTVLEESGAKWEDLVDVTVFLINMNRDFNIFNMVY